MNKRFLKSDKGQVIPIIAISLVVIIMMVALLIDGADLMLNRRSAQNAADAGALAGAQALCSGKTESEAIAIATSYVTENNAELTQPPNVIGDRIQVFAQVQNDSFFAMVFNQNTLISSATAEAGCFSPKGNFLMPIAWSCRPPIGPGTYDMDKGCKMQALDYYEFFWPFLEKKPKATSITIDGISYDVVDDNLVNSANGLPPPQIYIVMDKLPIKNDPKDPSDYVEVLCKEDLDPLDPLYATAIMCDLNGDGRNDIEGGGNRGWLDLNNGGGGTSSMREWITNGLDFPLSPHTWLSGEPGTTSPVYEDVKEYRQGEIVLIPVFNAICDDKDPTLNNACMTAAHSNPWLPEPATGDIDEAGAKPKFHIVSFDAFYISCVHTKKKDDCPGFNWAQTLNNNLKKDVIRDNTPSIEGYFISGYEFPIDVEQPCLLNLGNCTVSLTN